LRFCRPGDFFGDGLGSGAGAGAGVVAPAELGAATSPAPSASCRRATSAALSPEVSRPRRLSASRSFATVSFGTSFGSVIANAAGGGRARDGTRATRERESETEPREGFPSEDRDELSDQKFILSRNFSFRM
jgi:hypothetical protein